MADITLANANMLYVRYVDTVEREFHVPLSPLYLTTRLEDAGYDVNFRDYQRVESDDPFQSETIADFMGDSAQQYVFDFIQQHPDLFPGFFHIDLETNVFPKLRMLQEFGFYPADEVPADR